MAGPGQRGPLPPDGGFAQMARGAAGAALGSVLAGLPVLWGQLAPVVLSAGLAIFWTFLALMAWKQYGARARYLLLAGPLAWLWPAVGAYLIWRN